MISQIDFINKIHGAPWIDRGVSFDGCDCYGIVILYYKHVLGIDLPSVDGFDSGVDFIECYQSGIKLWKETKTPEINGLLFTCYEGGQPSHVGIAISKTKALHSRGTKERHGKVEIHSIRAIEQIYGKITYHKFLG